MNTMPTATETAPAAAKSSRGMEALAPADKHIWGIFIALCIISVIELYSASSREVVSSGTFGVFGPIVRHCIMLLMGALVVIGLSRVPYKYFMPATPIIALLGVGMMVYVMFFGEIVNGARRSLTLLGFTIQPSEILKLSAVLVVALIMSRTQMKRGVKTKGVVASAIIVVILGGVLFQQGLTNFVLLMSISVSMMLIGGVQWKKFLVVMIIYAIGGAGIMYMKKHADPDEKPTSEVAKVDRTSTQKGRLSRWDPFRDKSGDEINRDNRQEMFSYMAQANGGIIGVFPGNSRETARLPLAFSDYIFAIIIEDLGFVGAAGLLLLYLWLLARAGSIASHCSRAFPAMLVMGMAVMICFQALFHMGITSGVLPVSGQPLPLISKGGTSILVTSCAFGIMLSVSRYAARSGKRQDAKQELNALPEELHADNPTQL
ncbi:MAG: FtsW/RodA/SpoVE family cell cycle protein [Muribaculaceae bacterium]